MDRKELILRVVVLVLIRSLSLAAAQEASNEQVIAPAKTAQKEVPEETMKRIYEEVKTAYKYGIIIRGEGGKKVDCPSVFRHADKWYLVYIIFDGNGYETAIAESNDLLQWGTLGKILTFGNERTWDCNQVAGYIALQEHIWGGSYQLQRFDHKYWMSYIGGALKGYETDPLAIGIAWSRSPVKAVE
ncbi:MAG: hypothetical protein ACYSR6_04295 [Planctomycetota bacterium]|jgi:beta-xylosidase